MLSTACAQADAVTERQFEQDRHIATSHITAKLRSACLSDFLAHHAVVVHAIGSLRFSEPITSSVYHTLYWTNADRGVAFLMPVAAQDEHQKKVNMHVACFYALSEKKLTFQLSQQMKQDMAEPQ